MADTHELIVDVLRDLTKENLRILRSILNNKALCGKTIPTSQLENVNDPYEMAEILKSYYSTDATEVLLKALEDIPRKDLAKRLHDKIKAGKVNEYEGPNDETDSQPVKRAKYDELEPYLGTYRLSDLTNYARNNQDQLIKQLEKQLEPSALNKLKEQLSWSQVKNHFLFTADQCHQLFTNQALKRFLEEVPQKKKFQELPEKILEILFFKIKHKKMSPKDKKQSKDYLGEQKLEDQREELLANKEKEEFCRHMVRLSLSKEGRGSVEEEENFEHVDIGSDDMLQNFEIQQYADIENESYESGGDVQQNFEIQGAAGVKNKSYESGGYIQKICKAQKTVPEKQTQKGLKMAFINWCKIKREKFYKVQKIVAEKQTQEDLKMAFINWCKIKRENHQTRDHMTFDAISVHEHKTYNCLIANNVFCFKLQEETDYCLLRVLHDKKDLTKKDI